MTKPMMPDTFTKWILGVSAAAIVGTGGWLGNQVGDLNKEIVKLSTNAAYVVERIDLTNTQLAKFEYEMNQNTIQLNSIASRVTRLEVLIEKDNTRIGRRY